MELFKGPYVSVDAASRHFSDLWPNSAIANSTTHVFHLLQGRVQKIIYFSKFLQWNNNWNLDLDFNLKCVAYKWWF